MTPELAAVLAQFPVVGLCVYFLGKEIKAMNQKLDDQNKMLAGLLTSTTEALVENSAVLAALKTTIERTTDHCKGHEMEESRTRRRERGD